MLSSSVGCNTIVAGVRGDACAAADSGLFYLCSRSLFAAHLHSRFLPLAHVLALVSSPGMSDGGLFYLYSRSVYEVHVRSDGGEGMPIVVGLFYLYSRSLLH